MKVIKRHWLIIGLVVVAIGILAAFKLKGGEKTSYFTTPADHGDIRELVEATGTINAVTTVQVGSQVSGTIAQLFADFNSRVKKGQVVAQIDPALFQANLLQAQADAANAKANLIAAQANLEKAKATALQSRTDYDRTVSLAKEGVLSQQQLDLAKATSDTNEAGVSAAAAQVTQAAAQAQQKDAAVKVAQTNLDTQQFMRRSMAQSSRAASTSDKPWPHHCKRPPCSLSRRTSPKCRSMPRPTNRMSA